MKKRIAMMAIALVLVAALSVGGTLAYLTSTTGTLTNTFTIGKVAIDLSEVQVNDKGLGIGERIKADANATGPIGNEYKLYPGATFDKDPTVTIKAGSDEAYVRMMVKLSLPAALNNDQLAIKLDGIFTGYDVTKWPRAKKTVADDKMSITYEYRYIQPVGDNAGADRDLEPLFKQIVIPNDVNAELMGFLNGMKIEIQAHAIQADQLANADAAWAAFDAQVADPSWPTT